MTALGVGLVVFVLLYLLKQALLTIAWIFLLVLNLTRQSATIAIALVLVATFAVAYLSAR